MAAHLGWACRGGGDGGLGVGGIAKRHGLDHLFSGWVDDLPRAAIAGIHPAAVDIHVIVHGQITSSLRSRS